MYARYITVGVIHFVGVALILKYLQFILPHCMLCCYTLASHFVMCIIVAKLTFRYAKERILSSRISPENKAVLITGCGSGFGNGLARQLDSKGFHVFASCLFPSESGAEDLRRSCSKRLQILQLDVTKDESVQSALDFVKANLGQSELWCVVNNAGVLRGCFTELTGNQEFRDTMEVNAFGTVWVTKAFLPLLKKSRGRVVNLTSIGGRLPVALTPSYAMSKFAAVGFTESLRQELYVSGVRVISVEPEAFQTGMTNPENLMSLFESSKTSVGKEVISTYGDHKDFQKFIEYTQRLPSSKVSKVLDAMEKAVSLKYPDVVYQPCRNILIEMGIRFFTLLPKVVQDLIVVYVHFLIKAPTPEN